MLCIWKGSSNLDYIFKEFIGLLDFETSDYHPCTIGALLQAMWVLKYLEGELVVNKSQAFYVAHTPKTIEEYKENLKRVLL